MNIRGATTGSIGGYVFTTFAQIPDEAIIREIVLIGKQSVKRETLKQSTELIEITEGTSWMLRTNIWEV